MSKIEFTELPADGRMRFPQLLAQIKGEQLASTRHRGMWARLAEYENENSGRDAANRLTREHKEFNFTARKEGDKVVVFAQLKAEVTE